ncbi:MAG: hypothetical protein ACE15E_04600 [Acidobacteriota bacterium]
MILLDVADTAHEVCSGPSYPTCPVLRKAATGQGHPAGDRSLACPSLHESLVQYCTAGAFKKFVPASEPRLVRCGRPAYRYCDLYREAVPVAQADTGTALAPGVCLPAHLGYARNHMWMDQIGTRQCQIGIDAFLAGMIHSVDQLSFLAVAGVYRPTVVLTVRGVDLRLTFPAAIAIRAANLYLRARTSPLTEDPYGAGWLFEGELQDADQVEKKLLRGAEATSWMKEESRRLESWIREHVPGSDGEPILSSGRPSGQTWIERLSREELLSLFEEFLTADLT